MKTNTFWNAKKNALTASWMSVHMVDGTVTGNVFLNGKKNRRKRHPK